MLQQVENGLIITDDVQPGRQITCRREMMMPDAKRWHWTYIEAAGTNNTESLPVILYEKLGGVTITPVCYVWRKVNASLEISRLYAVSLPDEPVRFIWQGLNPNARVFFKLSHYPGGVTAEQEITWKDLLLAQGNSVRALQAAAKPALSALVSKKDFQAQWSAQYPSTSSEGSAELTPAQKAMVETMFANSLPRNVPEKLFPLWGDLLRAVIIGNITEVVLDETSDIEHDLSLDAHDLRRILWPSNIDKLSASFSENEALPTLGMILHYYLWLLSREVAYYKNNPNEEVVTPPHPLDKATANTPVGQLQRPAPYGLTQEEQAYFAWLYQIYSSENINENTISIPVEKLARLVMLINHYLANTLVNNEPDIRERDIMRDFVTCVMLESEHDTEEALRHIQHTLQEKSHQVTTLILSRQECLRAAQEALTQQDIALLLTTLNNNYHYKILPELLIDLPSEQSMNLIQLLGPDNLQLMIKNGELGIVLALLPEANRFSFCVDTLGADTLKAIITDGYELGYVLAQLPEAHRVSFCNTLGATTLKAIITDAYELGYVLARLPEAHWLSFCNTLGIDALKAIITNGYELGDVLAQLPKANRFSFCVDTLGVDALKAIITGEAELGKVLAQLPEANRFSFCIDTLGVVALKAIITDGAELGKVLAQLPEAHWLSFCVDTLGVVALKAIIIDGSELGNVLAQLPEAHWLSFCNTLGADALKAIITNGYGLGRVLARLPEANRFSFCNTLGAAALKALITNAYELGYVLAQLPEANWLSFCNTLGTDALKAIITNATELGNVLVRLPEANRFSFCVDTLGVAVLKAIITDGYALSDILAQLPEANRFSFCVDTLGVARLKAIITDGSELGYVLARLPGANRLSFCVDTLGVDALKVIIAGWAELGKVLAQLPQANRFSFCIDALGVNALKAIITNATGLANVLVRLPEANRFSFCVDTLGVVALKAIITDGSGLDKVLAPLPEANCLSFCIDSLGCQFIVSLKDNDAILKQLYNADKNSAVSLMLLSERIKFTTDNYIVVIKTHRQNSWFHGKGDLELERAEEATNKLAANPPLSDVMTLLQAIDEKSDAVFSLPHSLKNMLTTNLKCFFATAANQNPSLGEIIQELRKLGQRDATARLLPPGMR